MSDTEPNKHPIAPSYQPQKPSYEEIEQQLQELRLELKELQELSFRDALTALGNRRYAEQRVLEELARLSRGQSHGFSLLMIDVDDFKFINDCFGHQCGDNTLRWLGKFLRDNIRENDVACRVGGDEFIVIMPELDKAAAQEVQKRLDRSLQDMRQETACSLQISMGVSSWSEEDIRDSITALQSTPGMLLSNADSSMYEAKRQRKAEKARQAAEIRETEPRNTDIPSVVSVALCTG